MKEFSFVLSLESFESAFSNNKRTEILHKNHIDGLVYPCNQIQQVKNAHQRRMLELQLEFP